MRLSYTCSPILILALALTTDVLAGSGVGGGGPPAKEMLDQMLMSYTDPSAGLFSRPVGDFGLSVRGNMTSNLSLTTSSDTQSLRISRVDFDLLRAANTVDAVPAGDISVDPTSKSYRIEDGDREGELLLKDRRAVMRDSVK